jgi:hypothetical protein
MKTNRDETNNLWQEVLKPRTFAAAMLIIAGLGFAVWAIANLWALLLISVLCVGALYLYRMYRGGIRVAEGVTVTQETLKSYLLDVIREIEGDEINADLILKGTGDNLVIKLAVDFPSDSSQAADFHSKVIYLQGYLARRLYDDFRISGAKVEIEAAKRGILSARPKNEETKVKASR